VLLFMMACAVDRPSTCARRGAGCVARRAAHGGRHPRAQQPRPLLFNWVKLRAWDWVDYDALVLLDADTLVRGDLTHLFGLPAEFAWAGANGHGGYDWNRGGVLLMRPCAATFAAMMYVVHTHEHYQFRDALAEQDFLAWFFRYTLLALPMRYNLNFQFLDAATGLGPGGAQRTPASILINMCLKPSKMNDAIVTSRPWANEHNTSAFWGACHGGAPSCSTCQTHGASQARTRSCCTLRTRTTRRSSSTPHRVPGRGRTCATSRRSRARRWAPRRRGRPRASCA
jgi:hypothetical protein